MSARERARSVTPGPELSLQLPLARTSARQLRVALAELLAERAALQVAYDLALAAHV